MNAQRLVIACLLGLQFAFAVALNADQADERFAHLGAEEGLGGRILDIEQDPLGFMWFATQTGLHQYDGSRLTTHRHQPGRLDSLSESYVHRLLVTSTGDLWAGTNSGHLNRWIPEEERFQRLDDLHLGGPLSDLAEVGPDHFLVLVEWQKAFSVSVQDGKAKRLPQFDDVQTLVVDAERQAVWGIGARSVKRYALHDLSLQQEIPWPPSFKAPSALFLNATLARDGSLWAAAYDGGAVRFHPDKQEMTAFQHVPGDPTSLSGNDLTSVLQDTSGTIWLAGFSGWNRLDEETESFHRFTSHPIKDRGLVNHQIHSIFEDRTGQLWLGTDAGAARFDPLRERFRFYSYDPTQRMSAPPGSIRSFAEDEQGRLWIGTRDHGVARLDRRAGEAIVFSTDSSRGRFIPDDTAWALSYEEPGRLWIGNEGGLLRLDIETGTWQQFPPENYVLSQRITALYRDRAQTLWAGGQYGLYRYDAAAKALKAVDIGLQSRITVMTEDSAGRLLVGTDGSGILALDRRNGQRLDYWPGNEQAPGQLTHGTVTALQTALHGKLETLWATTLDGGLHRLTSDGQWNRVASVPGLPAEAVVALQAEPDGTLWLSTGLEAFRFEPNTGDIQSFQAADGFPSWVEKKASYQSPTGELFFGGLDGFIAFMPNSVQLDTAPPRVVLTKLQIGSETMLPQARQPDSPLSESITLAESVTLRHHQNNFTLEFAALHFGDPASNRFSYKMDGVDGDWVEQSAERSFARYARIPAGRHLFRVKAANRDGVWSEETQLWVHVMPPPWRSWWAWTLYALAVLGLVIWWTQARTARLRLEKELQEQELKVLRGLLPICSTCKKIRDDEGEWEHLETYLGSHSDAQLTHGICPTCAEKILGHPV